MNIVLRGFFIFLVFVITFGTSYFIINSILNRGVKDRFQKLVAGAETNNRAFARTRLERFLDFFTNSVLSRLMKFSSPKENVEQFYKKKFIVAGLKQGPWVARYLGLKTLVAVALPFVFLIFASLTSDASFTDMLLVALLLAIGGYYLPNGLLAYKIKNRKQDLFDAFPDALDLIRVCVQSGMGLDAAITRVGNEMSTTSRAMAEEFTTLNLELRAGLTRAAALQNFAIRTDLDEVKALVAMIIQAERYGASVSDALLIFSEDLRSKRRLRAQELAAKIPVKLSLPIILFIFPAIFVIMLGPPIMSLTNIFTSN